MSGDLSPAEIRHLFAVGAADARAVLVACQADPPEGSVIEGLSRPRLEMALLALALLVVDKPAALDGFRREAAQEPQEALGVHEHADARPDAPSGLPAPNPGGSAP